jgi:hypothetical protein
MISTEAELSFIKDESERNSLELCVNNLGICCRAFLELHTVLDNMHLTLAIAKRYPWGGKTLTKSQHLSFVWLQFINLCYMFHNKYKLSANQYNRLMRFFGVDRKEDVGQGLKLIRKNIGHFIKDRGNHTHDWSVQYQSVHIFGLVEFVSNHGKEIDPCRVSEHYRDAKFFLCEDIKEAIRFMETFLLKGLDGYAGHTGEIIKKVSDHIENLRKEQAVPSEAESQRVAS